ncbi:hypothetical protein CLU90_4007 [Janthinobacterium sp. 67]|uniref:hypothetical protein n=1 Tax=Janthinobacterium sp. 67 TaxID=2035207 RepID=UPI000C235967|nr:hypothetical protein [Janthinobacterium sp. 67]PJJ20746.1 hypothetical protein CLU90_4007 [Janthinobacterium sp. 67]
MWATLIGYFGFENTSKIGMRVWAVTTLTAMVAALWAAGQVCANVVCGPVIQSISQSHPMFAVGLSLGFNPVTYTLASVYCSVWAACALYTYKKTILDKLV